MDKEQAARERAVKGWSFYAHTAEQAAAVNAFLDGGECPEPYRSLYALARGQLGLK